MSDTLDNDPHVGYRTGSGEWVVRATRPGRNSLEDDIVGFLGKPCLVTRVRLEARRFTTLGDALQAGYDARPQIAEDWTADELPVRSNTRRGVEGSTGRA